MSPALLQQWRLRPGAARHAGHHASSAVAVPWRCAAAPAADPAGVIQRMLTPALTTAALLAAAAVGCEPAGARSLQTLVAPQQQSFPSAAAAAAQPLADTADVAAAFLDGQDPFDALDDQARE